MRTAEGDLRHLRPLFRFAYYFGVCPIYDIGEGDGGIRPWYKYYGIILMCCFVLGYAAILPRVIFTVENDFPTSLIVIENISMLSLSAALVTYAYKVTVRHADAFRKRLLELIHSDRFPSSIGGVSNKRRVYAELIVGTACILLCVITDMYFSDYSVGGTEVLSVLGAYIWYIQEYYLYLEILVVRNYVLALRGKFESMNDFMVKMAVGLRTEEAGEELVWNFGEVPRLYTALCEQVVFCDRLFGLPLLCLTVYCLGEVLYAFTIIFVSHVMNTENNAFNDDTFFSFYIYIWAMHVLVYLFLILSACEATTKEMKRTCVLCYRLLHELQNGNRVLNCDDPLRDSLTLLALQSGACTPIFSAAGLFPFDNSSLFTLFNIVLSYLLTVIQLS